MSENALMVQTVEPEEPTIDGRTLQQQLGSTGDYSNWFKYQENRFYLVEGDDFKVYVKDHVNPSGGRPALNHQFTMRAAKRIAMSQNSPAAKAAHVALIELENDWNSEDRILTRGYAIAVRRNMEGAERDRYHLALIADAKAVIEEQRPKVEIANLFLSGEGTYSPTDAARMLHVRPHKFIDDLVRDRYAFVNKVWYDKRGEKHTERKGTAYACKMGYIKNILWSDELGHQEMRMRITPVGVEYFRTIYPPTDRDGSLALVKFNG